jgi:hypothetical protein
MWIAKRSAARMDIWTTSIQNKLSGKGLHWNIIKQEVQITLPYFSAGNKKTGATQVAHLIIKSFSGSFLYIISTTTDSDYVKFSRCKLKVWQHCHVCNFLHKSTLLRRICRHVYNISSCKINMHGFNGSIAVVIKPKYTQTFRAVAMFSLNATKMSVLEQSWTLFEDPLPHKIPGLAPTADLVLFPPFVFTQQSCWNYDSTKLKV